MNFTWTTAKNKANLVSHGISFEVASEVFADPNQIVLDNYFYASDGEQRYQIIGMSENVLLLSVIYVDRSSEGEETIHLISARKADKYERSLYADQFE